MSEEGKMAGSSERCACGETIWVEGRGWPSGHTASECLVQDKWVRREWFAKPPAALVAAWKCEEALHFETIRERDALAEDLDRARGEINRLTEALHVVRSAVVAQARFIAHENGEAA